ncbi:hypothetical protein HaLaN_20812 [Haematococcus lacustris]|uniref:Right handed beta helix domain-containing protein n=1 Tax=Haematococcus lacustris TaxID=44745 RepID=A0A699ZKF0_HAELA|nr:hypothetical protein HaLaN_20812 [Haematococcus lacustris]
MGSTPLRVNVSQLARESVALGGGLYVESSHATVQLISCRFIANKAGETETAEAPEDAGTPVSGQGGGAWITAHALTIVRTNFTSNMALGAQSTGGGLHASSTLGPMHLLSASLTANKAGLAGGGAELSTASSLEVHGCNFTANAAGELMGVDALKAQLADPKTSAYVEGGGLRALGPESGQQAVRFSALSTVFNSNYASFHGVLDTAVGQSWSALASRWEQAAKGHTMPYQQSVDVMHCPVPLPSTASRDVKALPIHSGRQSDDSVMHQSPLGPPYLSR